MKTGSYLWQHTSTAAVVLKVSFKDKGKTKALLLQGQDTKAAIYGPQLATTKDVVYTVKETRELKKE